MKPRKLRSLALLLTMVGVLALVPPLVRLALHEVTVLGIPLDVLYLFCVWGLLIVGAGWLAYRLEADPEQETR